MMNAKRLWIATVLGLLFGLLAWLSARYLTTSPIPWSGATAIILSRGVLGLAIGLSTLRLAWWCHGLLLGFIFSLPPAFGALWVGMRWTPEFLAVLVGGLVIGFLIELIATVVLKAGVARVASA